MPDAFRDRYLETEVLTATPQRLQLMLIEGALRFAHQAAELWQTDNGSEAAYLALVRCRDIIAQIYGAIRQDTDDLTRHVAAVYLFLFTELAQIPTRGEHERLRSVIRVLEEERTTWQQVCAQMPAPPAQINPEHGCREITSADTPPLPADGARPDTGHGDSLSLEA